MSFFVSLFNAHFLNPEFNFSEFLQKRSICFLDTELTGFDSNHSRVLELSTTCYDAEFPLSSKPVGKMSSLISVSKIPESSTKIHGITLEMVKNSPNECEVYRKYKETVGKDPILVSHSNYADKYMIDALADRCDIPRVKGRWIDTYLLSHFHSGKGSKSLQEVAKRLGCSIEEGHRTDPDVRMTECIFRKMTKNEKDMDSFVEKNAFV